MILQAHWRKTARGQSYHLVGDESPDSRAHALCGTWPRYPFDEPWGEVVTSPADTCKYCRKAVRRHFPQAHIPVPSYPVTEEHPW